MYPALALGSFLVLLFLTVPIAIAIGLASFVPGWLGAPVNPSQVIRTIVTALDSFPLLAVPLFMVAGDIMTAGGLVLVALALRDARGEHTRDGPARLRLTETWSPGSSHGGCGRHRGRPRGEDCRESAPRSPRRRT